MRRFAAGRRRGGVYVAYEGSVPGVALGGRLPAMVERVLLAQQAPRLMRWGDSEFRFVRPVRGVLMQWGGAGVRGGDGFGGCADAAYCRASGAGAGGDFARPCG